MRALIYLLFFISTASAYEKPNFVFFFTDDQSYTAMGCMGNSEIHTPEMDKLGQQGIIFDRHYNTTAICMASRANTMTGLLEYKAGCNFNHGSLSKDKFQLSYPALLRDAGYYTGFAGKFGFPVTDKAEKSVTHETYDKLPVASFDEWAGGVGQSKYKTADNKYIADYAKDYPHSSRAYGAWASDFIKNAKRKNKPFCLTVFYKAPHLPFEPDPFFDHIYEGKTFSKPSNFGQVNGKHLAQQPKLGRQYLSYQKKYKYFGDEYNDIKRKYYQLISGVDYSIGMIREALEKEGLADNTIIILSSDNGYSEGAHGFSGKCLPYEEPSRAPLIIFDPRNKNNQRRVNTVTGGIDIAPTILDIAGVEIPSIMDGISLRPLIDNSKKSIRKYLPLMQLFGSSPTHSLAIVSDEWKYIYWAFEGDNIKATEELFNLDKDSLEMTNLAQNPEFQDNLEEMRTQYDSQLQHWDREGLKYNDYQNYPKIFDRNTPWAEKESLYSKGFISIYKKETGQSTVKKSKKNKKDKKNKEKKDKKK